MKWYKHMTDAHRDERLVKIHEEWGMWGLGVWWDLVARVAEQYTIDSPPSACLSVKELCQYYGKTRRKLSEYLSHVARLRLALFTNSSFPSDFEKSLIDIEIPNVAKIKDNHQRNLQATCKSLATKEQIKSKRKRVEKEKETPPAPPDETAAQSFWQRYDDTQRPVVEATMKAIATTRKSGVMADSVRLAVLRKLDSYPLLAVVGGCQLYLDRGYAEEGKRENYLYGVIRGVRDTKEQRVKKETPNAPSLQPAEKSAVKINGTRYSKGEILYMADNGTERDRPVVDAAKELRPEWFNGS